MANTIYFQSISLEGYRSYQEQVVYSLSKEGIYLIKGNNGAGKSSLFTALCYALFGESVHKVKQGSLVNKGYRKGCQVTVSFRVKDTDYLVVRNTAWKGKTYKEVGGNGLELYSISGGTLVPVGQTRDKTDRQQVILDVLGMDYDTFCRSVYFAQRGIRFLSLPQVAQKELLRTLLSLEFVDSCKEKALAVAAEYRESVRGLENERESKRGAITVLKESIAEQESRMKALIEERNKTLGQAREQLQVLATKKSPLQLQVNKIKTEVETLQLNVLGGTPFPKLQEKKDKAQQAEKIRGAWLKFKSTKDSLQYKKSELEEALAVIQKDTRVCPMCGSEWKSGAERLAKVAAIETDIKQLQHEISAVDTNIANHTKSYDTLKDAIEVLTQEETAFIRDATVKTAESRSKVQQLQATLREREAALYALQRDEVSLERQVQQCQKDDCGRASITLHQERLMAHEKSLAEIETSLANTYEKVKYMLWWREDFVSSDNIGNFIVNYYLDTLNRQMSYYASKLGVQLSIHLDNSKKSAPLIVKTFIGGRETSYAEMSGGEKTRADLVLWFTLHDMFSYKTMCNIMVMDEPFEGLDSTSLEYIAQVLKTKADQSLGLHIITHDVALNVVGAHEVNVQKSDTTGSCVL